MSEYKQPDVSLIGDEHVATYRATDGELGYIWNGATCLILTTKGRRWGEPRSVPLIFATDGDRQVIIASKGGAPDHPAWFKNIVKNPAVEVQIKGDRFKATARTAKGDEREHCWAKAVAIWPNYDEYTNRTTRVIPVVVLEKNE